MAERLLIAGHKFLGHLRYSSTELICLSLFDIKVSDEEKSKIVRAIESNRVDDPTVYEIQLNKFDISVMSLSLSDSQTKVLSIFFEVEHTA